MLNKDEENALLAVRMAKTIDELKDIYTRSLSIFRNQKALVEAVSARKKELTQ